MRRPETKPENLTAKDLEEVLVVSRSELFPNGPHAGISEEAMSRIQALVETYGQFKPRFQVENNPEWQQIIAYLIFKYRDKYWLMKRAAAGGEARLHHLYSLGIGGHIKKEDLERGEQLVDWAKREFDEEVEYQGRLTSRLLGILNDDSNEVGRVHVGLVVLIEGDTGEIAIKEDDNEEGQLLTLTEMEKYYDQMENWSRIVFDYLRKK